VQGVFFYQTWLKLRLKVDECKPLPLPPRSSLPLHLPHPPPPLPRVLHSSTSQLNLSRF